MTTPAAAPQLVATEETAYLDAYLKPFERWLRDDRVTEIFYNAPGELWVELVGGAMRRAQAPLLTDDHVRRLAEQVARYNRVGVNREHPLLTAALPTGERVQIVSPPATRRHWALAIRRPVALSTDLDRFLGSTPVAISRDGEVSPIDQSLQALLQSQKIDEFLTLAVRARKSILISGGTSTGKTSLLNALIARIPEAERLIFVEDAPELPLTRPNAVGLISVRGALGEARVDVEELLNASLRMRPDRIILGELRGAEAATFLRAINTGHPGSVTTIHADSPRGAFEQIALMALQAGLPLSRRETIDYVRGVIDIGVHMTRDRGSRRIAEIAFDPKGGPARG